MVSNLFYKIGVNMKNLFLFFLLLLIKLSFAFKAQINPKLIDERVDGTSWIDKNGNAYVFGGYNDVHSTDGLKNDLWEYISSNTPGVPGKWFELCFSCEPLARHNSTSWTDKNGNAYVFGGNGFTEDEYYINNLNDLWEYTPSNTPGTLGIWTKLCAPCSLSPRYSALSWTDKNGNAYVFGGEPLERLNDLWEYTPSNTSNTLGTWTKLCDPCAPLNRIHAAAWTDKNGNAYVYGGVGIKTKDNEEEDLSDLWQYIPSNTPGTLGTWTKLCDPCTPSKREGTISWTDKNGNAYLYGGKNNKDGDDDSDPYLKDLWEYIPSVTPGILGSWVELCASCGPLQRAKGVAWTDKNGNSYLFGGDDDNNVYNDLWEFVSSNQEKNSSEWIKVCDICSNAVPTARANSVSWTDKNNNKYIFGGTNGTIYYNDLWKYIPPVSHGSGRWVELCDSCSPLARSNAVSWVDSSGKAYIFGGTNGTKHFNDLWEYIPSTEHGAGKWLELCDSCSPSGRSDSVSWIDSNGSVYIYGGTDGKTYFNDLWKYTSPNISDTLGKWLELCNTCLSSGRSGSIVWVDNIGSAYLYGGENGIHNFNELWKYANGIWTHIINSTFSPSYRTGSLVWTDNSGNAYIYGGQLYNSYNTYFYYNDLWKYSPSVGSNNIRQWERLCVNCLPAERSGSALWKDNANVYIFGGKNGKNYLNDFFII